MFVQHAFFKRDDNDIGPYSWNITGTYKGNFSSVRIFVMVMHKVFKAVRRGEAMGSRSVA